MAQGYERLNRDERGGSLSSLVAVLQDGLKDRRKRWVLDNTYPTRKSRNEVIECAWENGIPVRCIHLTSSVPEAQINAITRLIEIHGRLPMPEELRERGKSDPRYFGPDAQFRYDRSVELPDADEGFSSIESREFVRRPEHHADVRALFIEYDDVLVRNISGDGPPLRADDVALTDDSRDTLRRLHAEGWLLFAQAWRPHVVRGEITRESVEQCFERTRELLGVEITLAYCPHDAGPAICWCRKPLPGLILEFTVPRRIDLKRSVYIGRGAADRTISQRLGMPDAETFAGLLR
jgi:histidinol phosphatase-like enzyme